MKRFTRLARQTLRRPKWKFPGWQQQMIFVFLLIMAVLVGLDYYLQVKVKRKRETARPAKTLAREERLRLEIDRVLLENGVAPAWIEEKKNSRRVRIPASVKLDDLYQKMIARALQSGAEVRGTSLDLLPGEKELACMMSGRLVDAIRLTPDPKLGRSAGRIAIVIDDFGYSDDEVVEQFVALPFTITFAIIPGLLHSTALAQKLQQANKAFIVHMPMEALERRVEQNGYELLVASSPEEIRSRVRKAMAAIPGARGMNNHMGSRATQNEALLGAAFAELKKSDFFFLDSRTTPETRAYALAQKQGLAAGLNDTFLDTVAEADYVRKKLAYLAEAASARGAAIGIGHPHHVTLQVLRGVVPQLQRSGFELVPVEELIRGQSQQFSTILQ